MRMRALLHAKTAANNQCEWFPLYVGCYRPQSGVKEETVADGTRSSHRIVEGRMRVQVHSLVHDLAIGCDSLTGSLDANPENLTDGQVGGHVRIDLQALDAGGWLENRRLHQVLESRRFAFADVTVNGARELVRDDAGPVTGWVDCLLRFRERSISLTMQCVVEADGPNLRVDARTKVSLSALGIEKPRFLMFEIDDQMLVEVGLTAQRE